MSSREEDQEVIELGADGTFDISTPPKKLEPKQPPQRFTPKETLTPSSENLTSSASLSSQQPQIPAEEILNLVPVGEYKLFTSSGSKESFLILHLHEIEEPKDVRLVNHELLVELGTHSLSLNVQDLNIDESSIHTTLWRDFLTFRFFKLSQ